MGKHANFHSHPTLIRYALPGEASILADISRETFFETFAPYNSKNDMDLFLQKQFTKQKLMEEVHDPGTVFLLAEKGGELAGYAKAKDGVARPEDEAIAGMEIARLYARKKFIGKGVGSALMKACLDLACNKRKEMVWLGVWELNQRAIDFYTQWGFTKFGKHPFLLGRDLQIDWLMQKWL